MKTDNKKALNEGYNNQDTNIITENKTNSNNTNKALWIFANFRETVNTIPQKYRGRAWEILIEYAFNNEIDISRENIYVKLVVKSLLPLIKLRGKGGSIKGKSNNPTGKKSANIGANIGANVGANVGATPYITETLTETLTLTENNNKKEKQPTFKKPTFEEVKKYCEDRKNNINPQQFVDYYTSNGWRIGKNPMKDWKACIRTWETNNKGKDNKNNEYTQENYNAFA